MPLLYGEKERAFYRLQEEILKQTEDFSLFLWSTGNEIHLDPLGVLATSPSLFSKNGLWACRGELCNYRSIESNVLSARVATYPDWVPPQITTRGLRIHAFVRNFQKTLPWVPVLLWTGCIYEQKHMCISLQRVEDAVFPRYGRISEIGASGISLINAQEFYSSFSLSEIYLATKFRNTGSPIPDLDSQYNQDPPDPLDIVISTRYEETAVCPADSSPPLGIRLEDSPVLRWLVTSSCPQIIRLFARR